MGKSQGSLCLPAFPAAAQQPAGFLLHCAALAVGQQLFFAAPTLLLHIVFISSFSVHCPFSFELSVALPVGLACVRAIEATKGGVKMSTQMQHFRVGQEQ
jgi:hypothetical protein